VIVVLKDLWVCPVLWLMRYLAILLHARSIPSHERKDYILRRFPHVPEDEIESYCRFAARATEETMKIVPSKKLLAQ